MMGYRRLENPVRYAGTDLVNRILLANNDIDQGDCIFAIAFSIITYQATFASSRRPTTPAKYVGGVINKFIEGGHATTFMIDTGEPAVMAGTGVSDDGWEIDNWTAPENFVWARQTLGAETHIFYTKVVEKDERTPRQQFQAVINRLEAQRTAYSILWPNIYGQETDFQNCVSSSHVVAYELGLLSWPMTKGFWTTPNAYRYWRLTVMLSPGWHYLHFPNTNTHIPPPEHAHAD